MLWSTNTHKNMTFGLSVYNKDVSLDIDGGISAMIINETYKTWYSSCRRLSSHTEKHLVSSDPHLFVCWKITQKLPNRFPFSPSLTLRGFAAVLLISRGSRAWITQGAHEEQGKDTGTLDKGEMTTGATWGREQNRRTNKEWGSDAGFDTN